MPWVVGEYRDKHRTSFSLLHGEPQILADCRQAIRWQVGAGGHGVYCIEHPGYGFMTAWHICEPAVTEPFVMICSVCGRALQIARGGFTWEAFHKHARTIWGDKIPLTVAELRLSMPGEL